MIGANRDVIVHYTVRQGVDAIVTNNRAEAEIVTGRGYSQRVTSATRENINGTNTLVLYVDIEPSSRPNVVKVK